MFILKLKLTNLFIMDTIYLRMTIILKNFLHLITSYIENNYSKIIVIQKFNSQILRIFTIYYFKNMNMYEYEYYIMNLKFMCYTVSFT